MTVSPNRNLGLQSLVGVWRMGSEAARTAAFLIAGGALSLQLSGLDPHAPVGAESSSVRSKLAFAVAFVVLLLSCAPRWRRVPPLVKANTPLLALPILALLSVLWAPEPMVALRRALAFALTILAAFAVVARAPGSSALRFLVRAIAAGVVLSIAYVAISPAYGLHQLTDGAQSVHVGDWRGLFVHRTVLGQLAALGLGLSIYTGTQAFNPLVRLGAILSCLACLVMAHSGGGWVSAAILLALPPVWNAGRRLVSWNGLVGAAIVLGALALLALSAPLLAPVVLHALGKDATLTGRTDLWRLMAQAAGEKPWLGYGYSTGFRGVVAELIQARSPYGYVPNAQNGYLDVVLNLGLVGLGLALAVLVLAGWRALRLAARSETDGLAPLLIVAFIVEMNVVEAALINADDIFVLIYATAAISSGEMLGDRRRSAVQDPGDDDQNQVDRQRLQA